jgi:urea transport system substrate-binding protein
VAQIIHKIKDSKPDVILNSINGDSNVAFFRALRASGISPEDVPVVSFSIGEQELRSMDIADVLGDYVARNYLQTADRPENVEFLKRFRAKYGEQRVVSDAMESAYVGVHLWAKAVLAAGSDDVVKIRDCMRGQEYTGPGGRVYIDPANLNSHRISRIGRVRPDGQFDEVWSTGSTLPPELFPKSRTRAQWNEFLQGLYKKWGNRWSGPIE